MMDHEEATKTMMAERYLLDELSQELRESFEEHAFDCPECALDLRAGSAFIQAAKAELPAVVESPKPYAATESSRKSSLFGWLRPAFAVPVFAALLLVIAYQNLSTIPSLRSAATEPRILPSISFHAGTRGAERIRVAADRTQGAMLSIDLPRDGAFSSYEFALTDPQGKLQWTRTIGARATEGEESVSLLLPRGSLQNGSYTLTIAGITNQGARSEVERRVLDVQLDN
jgi:hypothetical protein